MTTIEDIRRMAALAGERSLVAAIPKPDPIADLAACERAAGLATAATTNQEPRS